MFYRMVIITFCIVLMNLSAMAQQNESVNYKPFKNNGLTFTPLFQKNSISHSTSTVSDLLFQNQPEKLNQESESMLQKFLNRVTISQGLSYAWTTSYEKLDDIVNPDWVLEGHLGYFASIGFDYYKSYEKENYIAITYHLTFEKFSANFQYWDRTDWGTVNATVLRMDPFVLRYKKGEIMGLFNLIGVSLFQGELNVPVGYVHFYNGEPIVEMNMKQNSSSFTLLDFGIFRQLPDPHLYIGFETSILQMDLPQVNIKTEEMSYTEDVSAVYGLFPLKIRLLYEF